MFFKATVLKRMLKAAYKGAGLTVGHAAESDTGDPDGYYVSSGWWVIWFNADVMPKEAKAALIELCGDLPATGEVFRATKMGNQYEIEQKEIYNLPAAFRKCGCQFRVTNLLGQQDDTLIRFIQELQTQHVTAVSEIFIDLIDPLAVNYDDGEHGPLGPVATCPTAPFMYWGNNTCYLMAGIRTVNQEGEEADFWKYLEGIEIL